jgi:nucleoside-diphosphate-sugar epimerase
LPRARARRLVLPGGAPKLTDCTFIDNAVDAHLQALDRLAPGAPCAGRAYFISQGTPVAIPWLITSVLAAAGLPPVKRTLPPRALYLLGGAFEAAYAALGVRDREPPVTRFVARQLSTAHWFQIDAARRDLGYAPRVSLDEGLRRLAESLRA